jgi:hypothetical protein
MIAACHRVLNDVYVDLYLHCSNNHIDCFCKCFNALINFFSLQCLYMKLVPSSPCFLQHMKKLGSQLSSHCVRWLPVLSCVYSLSIVKPGGIGDVRLGNDMNYPQ